MSNLSSVLKQLIKDDDNLNVTELARLTGIVQPVMHRLVSGDTDNPKINTISPIADHFGISIDELVGRIPLPTQNGLFNRNKRKQIPIIQWSAILDWLQVGLESRVEIIESNVEVSDKAYAVIVRDSTMLPRFLPNSILLVDPATAPENGDFVVAITEKNSQPTFKQVLFDGDDTYLKPLNPDFKTLFFDKKSSPKFLGVVVEVRTKLKNV